jgi:hypothetical protein
MLLLILPAILVALAVLWLLRPQTAITPENAASIRVGMTVAQVEEILGGECRDESTGPIWSDESDGEDVDRALATFCRQFYLQGTSPAPPPRWTSDRSIVLVAFDQDDRVHSYDTISVHRVNEDPLTILGRWLRL